LFLSLISYAPEDPNFIFSENTEIKNILGFRGSYTSDIFYQSIGLISILIPFTIFFTGINVFNKKSFLKILENIFFIIIYSILGSLFFSNFHKNSFWLTINGNNGFIGNLFENSFLIKLINLNEQVSYYFLIALISTVFLLSINFSFKSFILFTKKILLLFKKKDKIKSTFEEKSFDSFEPIENISSSRIQENFSFEKKNEKKIYKFKLPSLDFLKKPTKKEREISSDNKIDDLTLEKILLDFGVEGKIKKISNGPVVTLNEFDPAPGLKYLNY
jgi:hypothetical protein